MSTNRFPYAAITPARNEAENLRRLAACLDEQTGPPSHWVIVDNGSSDDTLATARELAEARPWVLVTAVDGLDHAVRGGPVTRAFNVGLAAIENLPEVVIKLDADVSFEAEFCARLVGAFDDPKLGIASGTCYELDEDVWKQRHVTGSSVWGATRAYRTECLRSVMPLEDRMGWDGIDELKARLQGWETRTFTDLPFRHHRAEGERDGSRWRAWSAGGRAAHYMGYRWWYLIARSLFNVTNERAALGMLIGYFGAAARREERCSDPQVIAFLRDQQTLSGLPHRLREAVGRGVSSSG